MIALKKPYIDGTFEMAKEEFLLTGNKKMICKKYGLNDTTFTKYLVEDGAYGIRSTTISNATVKKIITLRKLGWGYKRIADEVSCDPKTVARYVKKNGIETSVIKRTNRMKNGKHTVNVNFFDDVATEEQAYWLGFLFADGSLSKNRITIRLKSGDKLHLELFKQHLNFSGSIVDTVKDTNYKKASEISSIEVNSTDLVRALTVYLPVGKKSDKIQMPKLKTKLYKHFIRGYFDGDGFVLKKLSKVGFCSNITFLESMKDIFSENGLAECKDGYIGNKSGLKYGELVFGKKVSTKIMEWMYTDASIYLKRKHDDFYSPGGCKTS